MRSLDSAALLERVRACTRASFHKFPFIEAKCLADVPGSLHAVVHGQAIQ